MLACTWLTPVAPVPLSLALPQIPAGEQPVPQPDAFRREPLEGKLIDDVGAVTSLLTVTGPECVLSAVQP